MIYSDIQFVLVDISSPPSTPAAYVARWGKGVYKIGCTSSGAGRYRSHQALDRVVCWISVPGRFDARALERHLHRRFAAKQYGATERFNLSPADVRWLLSLARCRDPLAACGISPVTEDSVLRCMVCGFEWKPRRADPVECPDCKSRLWRRKPGPPRKHLCRRCRKEWVSRVAVPKECPNCKSRNWR